MPTLYHPTIPDVTQEIDGNVKAWVDQGWLEKEPSEFVKARKDAEKASASESVGV